MARKKMTPKEKAVFLRRINKGRVEAGLSPVKAKGKRNAAKRRRKNPEDVIVRGPVYRNQRVRRPTDYELGLSEFDALMLDKEVDEDRRAYNKASAYERDIAKKAGSVAKIRKRLSAAEKRAAKYKKLAEERLSQDAAVDALVEQGGKIIGVEAVKSKKGKKNPMAKKRKARKSRKHRRNSDAVSIANPRRKRRKAKRKSHKRKKARRNPKADYGMVTVPNPRRKRRKAKRKSHKRRKSAQYVKVGEIKISKKGKRRIKNRRSGVFAVKKNPSVQSILWTAGGYVAALALYKLADHYSGGKVSAQISTVVPMQAQPLVLPLVGMGLGYALSQYVDRLPIGAKAQSTARDLGRGAMMTGGILAGLAAITIGLDFAKKQFPQLATTPVIGPMLSGVRFFPAPMGDADFGRLGQYHQQPGDFGNVRFFPKQMAGVDYFPEGSRGDQMYVPSEADQMREAQGLGVIPEGMGEIPEGMGEDMGHLG